MTTSFVLVDYENVQPKNLDLLKSDQFKVLVFVGENQSKLSTDLAITMQSMGDNARYVKINGNGPNALDFHIAYYLGQLSTEDSSAYYFIISRDRGFDPLIRHLKAKKIRIQRYKDISEIPSVRVSASESDTEKLGAIIKNLRARGQSKPRKLTTLTNTINNIFTENLPDKEITALVGEMENAGYITIANGKVSYSLKK